MKLLLLLAALVGYVSALCSPPYSEVAGGCIYVEEYELRDYNGARQYCAELAGDMAGDIASPSTCERFTDLARYIELNTEDSMNGTYYVGAKRVNRGWFWEDLTDLPLGPPFWAYDRGDMDGMDCGTMEGEREYQLSCSPCDVERNFICEAPPLKKTEKIEAVKPRDEPCPNGVQVGEFCYVFSIRQESWEGAEKRCEELDDEVMNGALFYPTDCDEYTLIARHIAVEEALGDYWVGARDTTGNHAWVWEDGVGVPTGIPYWAFDEPSHMSDGMARTHCGLLAQDKLWYMTDALCTEKHHYICKMHLLAPEL